MAEGRANAQTLVQPVGTPAWLPLAQFSDLHILASSNPPPQSPVSPRTNGLAIASLVLGAVGWALFCCGPVTWIISIIFAWIALSQINQSAGAQTGRGLARAGLGLSFAGFVVLAIWLTASTWVPTWQFFKFSHHGRSW